VFSILTIGTDLAEIHINSSHSRAISAAASDIILFKNLVEQFGFCQIHPFVIGSSGSTAFALLPILLSPFGYGTYGMWSCLYKAPYLKIPFKFEN
jgi:hypothetical protein